MLEIKQADLIERAKDEYLKGDLVMSEVLRNEEFYGLSKMSELHLLAWAGEENHETRLFTTEQLKPGRIDVSIKSNVEDIVDQKFQKAWRLIKKTRWQGHYNTRKRSRRF